MKYEKISIYYWANGILKHPSYTCSFQASLDRGELLNLKSNTDSENWEVQSRDGTSQKFPGVCFVIPPPDPEAINRVDL